MIKYSAKILLSFLALTALAKAGHVGNIDLLEGCGSCHVGHGLNNEPMLDHAEEKLCYQCHGTATEMSKMVSDGKLASWAKPGNIKAEFQKQYRHPVEEGSGHTPTERLPMVDGSPADHAECADCHNPHQTNAQRGQIEKVSGYSLSEMYLEEVKEEYEICLKCHSDNESFRSDGTNIRRQFDIISKSQHPVTKLATGKNRTSLTSQAVGMQKMKCSTCHTSDDANGPKGPHGSRYRFLLSGNYDIDSYADESPYAYQFCYSCHDRSSILGDESFEHHRSHIEGDQLSGRSGTSCYSCHASHGSTNDKLINFNPEVVSSSGLSNKIEYRSQGLESGVCYLTCHNHDHDPAAY